MFELREVAFSYNDVTALDGLNLTVETGQRIVLLGANGSGKSTLLSLLDGLCFPSNGSVAFCGQPLTEERLNSKEVEFDFRRRVGLVFQNPDIQLFNPTVFDEVAFGPLQLRWPREKIREQVNGILEEMGIAQLKDRSPHQLSTGEKDPQSESRMIDFLVGCSDGRKTVVTATHDLDLLEDIADCCHVFQNGRVVASGVPLEILADHELLRRTGLVHAHRHAHVSGEVHSHPHRHGHKH
jgi:cobalt/nickel transport system ATP-binding protein